MSYFIHEKLRPGRTIHFSYFKSDHIAQFAWTVLVYFCGPGGLIISGTSFHFQKCPSLYDKLYSHSAKIINKISSMQCLKLMIPYCRPLLPIESHCHQSGIGKEEILPSVSHLVRINE